MAIQLTAINKQADDRYTVTVQDTAIQTGVDEKDSPVYQSYSVTYNPATGKESLKANIEALLSKKEILKVDEDQILQDIKTTIEAIDTSKLGEVSK